LNAVYGKPSTSRHLLLERLKSGKIAAVAESSTWKGVRGDTTGLIAIQRDQWEHSGAGVEFRESGDVHFYLGHYRGNPTTVEVWYHGIKFDRAGIQDLVNLAPKHASAVAEGEPQQTEKGLAVSTENLKAWYEVYKRWYVSRASAHRAKRGLCSPV